MPLTVLDHPDGAIAIPPALQAVLSWETPAQTATLELRVTRADGRRSGWLPYVVFSPERRRSLDGNDAVATIATDTISAASPIRAIEIRANATLGSIAISTPPPALHPATNGQPGGETGRRMLDVPALSQYLVESPLERGWCAPASLAMLCTYWGDPVSVPNVAAAVYDEQYHGTGNWVFGTAFAARRGFFAAVAHVRGMHDAAALIAAGIPIAASIAWEDGMLAGAPLAASNGHLVVIRGHDAHTVTVNDPAHPDLVVSYPSDAFERCWSEHGGIAYVIAPRERREEILAIVNA